MGESNKFASVGCIKLLKVLKEAFDIQPSQTSLYIYVFFYFSFYITNKEIINR